MRQGTRGVALALALGAAGWSLGVALRRRGRLELRGQVAIVTGGGRGLGLAITRQLARRGCRLAICGRDADVIRRAVDELAREGAQVMGQACDASDPSQVQSFTRAVLARYARIDILVNNAGQCFVGPAAELESPDMERALRQIFWTHYHPTMAVLPHMRARGAGRIANITSIAGKLPIPHHAAYVAGKCAATGWSQTLGVELAKDGITVSTIEPPPLRNGAPLHAQFNGRREQELQCFARTLTSRATAISAERAARAVVRAIEAGERESAVSALSWLALRAHAVAPGLFAMALRRLDRRLPATAPPGVSSPMDLGAAVARAQPEAPGASFVRRAAADEARYMPGGVRVALAQPADGGGRQPHVEAE